MATELQIGETLPLSIAFLDQHGQPMPSNPIPDAPPQWANTTPLTEAVTAALDGLSANAVALAAGNDTIKVTLTVSGTEYTATLDVTVDAAVPMVVAPTLTSIGIVAGVPHT